MTQHEYTTACRDLLMNAIPDGLKKVEEQSDGSLFLEFSSPSGARVWLDTAGREVTVGFDLHHAHFMTFDEPDPEYDASQAIEYLNSLRSGKYRVVIWRRNGEFVMSSTIENAEDADASSWLGRWLLKDTTKKIIGW